MKLRRIVLEYLEEIKYQVKEHTYLNYYVLSRGLEDIEINKETPKNYLNEWLLKKQLSYSTKKMLKSLINRSLDFARKSKLLCFKHKITLKLEYITKKTEIMTKNEQKMLESYIIQKKKPHLYGIIICLYTGLRIGELLSLKWQNVDLKKNVIYVNSTACYIAGKKLENTPKTKSSAREIPISKNLKIFFDELFLLGGEYVIKSTRAKAYSVRSYQRTFYGVLNKLNIPHYNFHSLRHTFASRLMEKSVDVKTISDLMGHSKSNITLNTYIHSNPLQKNKALECLCA